METDTKKQALEAIHKDALKRKELCYNKEKDDRKLSIEDSRFCNAPDGQWSEEDKEKRANRPRFTINRIAGAIDQYVGDQRQNRTSIKIRPTSGEASEDNAEIFNGLIRNIEAQSKAENAYDNAYDEALTGGYGGFRILTQFNDDDSFEQDIRIKPILSSASTLWFDPSAIEYDKRDAKYAFLESDMGLEEFKEAYPNAAITDFTDPIYSSDLCRNWFRDETVKVAEYWVKIPITKNIGLLSDGRVIDLDEEKEALDEFKARGIDVVKERKAPSFKVRMYKMNGAEVLEGPHEWAGKHIPLIPVYGKISNIEGRSHIRGIVRLAKDPCRIYNYATSAAIEAAALSPKDPIWITKAQALGHEPALKTFNIKNSPFMFYNEDPASPGPPKRTGAPSVQTALLEQIRQAGDDIQATSGVYSSSLGDAPQLYSKEAVLSQDAKGDRGAYVIKDNLAKSIQYAGDQLVDLIPKIYDTPRMVRVLGIDGESELIGINQQALNEFNEPVIDTQTGKQIIVNDISMGKYESIVETGPAFNTLKQESAQQLIDLATGSPVFESLAMDLIAKNIGILEGDELTRRVRRYMIGQGTAEPTEEEIKELGLDQQQEDPDKVALRDNVLIQTENLKSQIEKRDADTDKVMIETQGETIKTLKSLIEALQLKQEMGILTPADKELLENQDGITEIMQDDLGNTGGDLPN